MLTKLTYAIGDVHGRLDLLQHALEAIVHHGDGRPSRTIMLGDYVDRGPDSRGVLELLMELDPATVTCLRGNHEAMMVDCVRSGNLAAIGRWFASGGDMTMASYGCVVTAFPNMRKIPKAHVDWLSTRPLIARDQHRVYVHAGLLPGRPVEHQDQEACLWIRNRFLEADAREFDAHVVHGHTPQWQGKPEPMKPELLGHRTNLDTGAYFTDVLTIGVFHDELPGGPTETLSIQHRPVAAASIGPWQRGAP